MYEPLWDGILCLSKKSNSFKISSIWMADMSNQGASGVPNDDVQGDDRRLIFDLKFPEPGKDFC